MKLLYLIVISFASGLFLGSCEGVEFGYKLIRKEAVEAGHGEWYINDQLKKQFIWKDISE
jgi:hypothetical protein